LETDRNWPTLGGSQGTISSSIGVDLPIPQKTHAGHGAMVADWQGNFVT